MIKDVVNPNDLNSKSTFLLVNAIYFKSKWHCEFDYYDMNSDEKNFTLANGEKIRVDMIFACEEFEFAENRYFMSVSIPYYLDDFDFVVVISKKNDDYKILENLTFHSFE